MPGDGAPTGPAGRCGVIPIPDINPTVRFPLVTILFIAANSAVFLYQVTLGGSAGESFVASYAFVPERLFTLKAAEGALGGAGIGSSHATRIPRTVARVRGPG